MRVAIAASLLKPISPESTGGTEAFAYILAEGLVSKGIDTTLFATSDSKSSAKLESVCSSKETTGVFEGDLDTRIPYQILQSQKIISQSQNFDLIHNNYFHFYLLTGLSAFSDIPIITTMHNHYWQLPNLKKILSQTQRKDMDVVVYASEAARSKTEDLFDSEVIYHGIDVSQFPTNESPLDYFMWFSRISPSKGIKDAMNAASGGNFPLKIAGGLPVRPDDKLYFEVNIEPYLTKNVEYIGSPSESGKIDLYKNAKALLFPTNLDEQFGLVMVESMSCGTPVIAYNRGAVSEVIRDGITGFIIDPDDADRPGKGSWIIKKQGVEGLVEATKRVSEIDRRACRKHVEDHFTRERMIDEYIKLYKRVAKNR